MKEIFGSKGKYFVTESGDVYQLLAKHKAVHGYITVSLNNKRCYLHRIIAGAFIPNPLNYPCINHKSGNKTDNRIENLEWCTFSQNTQHALKTGLIKPHPGLKGERNGKAKLNWDQVRAIRELIKQDFTRNDLAAYFGVDYRTISDIVCNRHWIE